MKRVSLRAKYTLALVAILVVLVGLQLVINRVFLPRYYLNQKLERIEEIRRLVTDYIGRLEEAGEDSASSEGTEAYELSLRTRCEAAGVDAIILRSDGGFNAIVFSNGPEQGGAPMRLIEIIRGRADQETFTVYAEGDGYRVYRTRDDFTKTEQIDCSGSLIYSDGVADRTAFSEYYYLLTVSVAEIEETSAVYEQMLIRIGLLTIVIGGITMFLVSGTLAKPIRQMTSISRKMADQDFSERYAGSRNDELQTLGENMNEMGAKLETAIENLKSANAKLANDISEKDELARQRKELLSNISHELKTPIAVIRGYAEGLRDGVTEDPAMRERYCGVIVDEAEKMDRLVRQLLDLDDLESRGTAVSKEKFDLAEMLRGEANAFMLRSQKEGIRLEVEVPDTLEIVSDDYLWEQVVQNYLSNAFQYVSPGGTVRICGKETAEGGVEIAVYNSGDPIPETSLDKLWNKFYKVDKARSREYGGSGIGLSIVKAAMDNLGGTCEAANTEGGVEFTARLSDCLAPQN